MYIITRILFLILSFFILDISAMAQLRLFVSPRGTDKNDGSIAKPFLNLSHALEYARNKGDKKVSIELREGVYYLPATINLNAASFHGIALSIQAHKNEKVIISAGRRLQLQWEPYRDGIFKAVVPEGIVFERLYVDGKLQVLARYPDYDSSARIFHGTAADALSQQRVKGWKHPEGGYVHALHAYEWGGFHYRITGADTAGNVQLEGGWQNNRPNKMHKEYRFVENIFEELDVPGEWYLDREQHVLYYYPHDDTRLSNAVFEVSHLKNSIELHGTAVMPLKNVKIEGIRFAHNERTFMDTKEPLLRSDWTIYRGGAILMDGTEGCKIADCIFEGIGGNAVMLSNYNKKDTITGCHIYNTGANAICFIGDVKAVRSASFRYEDYIPYPSLDKTPGPKTDNYPQDCVAAGNLLHDLGEIEKQATGVEIEIASSITVSHNTIYNTSRAGINIGDGCFGGHLLEYNDVFNTVRETGDHGSFNSWGRDRYWAPHRRYMDSLVAVHPELILLDARKQTIIRNNRFRCDHGWDIDLDDGSSNYHIYNNLCLNGGLKLREGFYRIVENNILINNSFHPHVWFKNSGDVFRKNIVMKKYAPIQITDWGKEVDYNLFPDTTALQNARKNGTDAHSIAGDPLFTDPANGDYRVGSKSPALILGFKNFPMDKFGVQAPELKRLAMQPQIPLLITDAGLADRSVIVDFLGGKVKSVDGLGDRSAYGLPDEKGVVVMNAPEKSLLFMSGLRAKDVIREAGGKPVPDMHTLIDIYQSLNWKGQMSLSIIRNQQIMDIELRLK